MKTCFSSRQLAHIWAAQGHPKGRNSSNSMYFHGPVIYSYGSHFPMAKIYNNGKYGSEHRYFVLVNSSRYSNSTDKHQSYVRSALQGRMQMIFVPNVLELFASENESYLLDQIAETLEFLWSRSNYYTLGQVLVKIGELNLYYILTGQKKRFQLDSETLFDANLITIEKNKLDIEKQAKKSLKQKIADEIHEAEKKLKQEQYATQIPMWMTHSNPDHIPQSAFPFDYIRLSKNGLNIETSRGATVPLIQTKVVLKMVETKHSIKNLFIGPFTIDSEPDDKGFVKIGCHRVNINQAREALGFLNKNIVDND